MIKQKCRVCSILLLLLWSTFVSASQGSLELVVSGLHEGNSRIISNGDVLFSGDSFHVEVSSNLDQNIYVFLMDSSGELTFLNNTNIEYSSDSHIELPGVNHWYRLDDYVGLETVVAIGSEEEQSLQYLRERLNAEDYSSLETQGITVVMSRITHLSRNFIRHSAEILKTSGKKASSLKVDDLDSMLLDANEYFSNGLVAPQVVNKIITGSQKFSDESQYVTRGIKEIHLFKKVAPSVVLVVTEDGGLGSGFLISDDGLVLTNWHVTKGFKKVSVAFMTLTAQLKKSDLIHAKVIKQDEVSDLALLKLESTPKDIQPLKINSSGVIEVGQDVHAIGHPKGEYWSYTNGIVSGLRPNYIWNKDHHAKLIIQTQTPINTGNSGGPLFNDDGVIVGVNSFIYPDAEGINYAVSSEDINDFLNSKANTVLRSLTREEKFSELLNLTVLHIEEMDVNKDGNDELIIHVDQNKNSKVDHFIVFNGKNIIRIIIDKDEDKKWDEMIFDSDLNGKLDTHLYDLNGDGKEEMIGFDDNEDGKVDRWIKA